MGSVVLLRALLRGMGREVECELMARKSTAGVVAQGSSVVNYLDCRILTAPSDLPDGEYAIHIGSQVIPVLRRRGQWL